MIRRIRDLLYDQGFTISGARNKLLDAQQTDSSDSAAVSAILVEIKSIKINDFQVVNGTDMKPDNVGEIEPNSILFVRRELFEIRELLSLSH